jgi:hypothetical protein
MKKAKPRRLDPDRDTMRPEYDFSKGVRGITARRYLLGTNVVFLAPDVAARFPSSEAVNEALRSLAAIADRASRRKRIRPRAKRLTRA